MPETVFLLSPANTSGLRAKQLTSPNSNFQAAQLYRSDEGVPIAVAFAFMSALYFRGKIAYALHFAPIENIFVIHGISGFVGMLMTGFFARGYIAALDGFTPSDAHRGGWDGHWYQLL